MSILSRFDLMGEQQTAAERLDTHLAVTAGAGSGKTRALVARYLNLVERGAPLRSLIAITFTEKAAREMRSRIRNEIDERLATQTSQEAASAGHSSWNDSLWQTAFIDLDSARIGTIHALCAELLRLHPAEAGVDPRFSVLEENLAAALKAQAVDTAMVWAAADSGAARLFSVFKESEVRRSLEALLSNRLEAARLFPAPDPLAARAAALSGWLEERCIAPPWTDSLAALDEHSSANADDKLETARREVLALRAELDDARVAADWDSAITALQRLRAATSIGGQKGNWDGAALETVRGAMRALRLYYDEALMPLVKVECRWELDRQAAAFVPDLGRLFDRALAAYQELKDDRRALDFDDLEDFAARMLTTRLAPVVSGVRAILVDEFQDTNDRQRQIVYALAGFDTTSSPPSAAKTPAAGAGPGTSANLFIVGDAKQGIYRFRGADIAVFRRIQADIGGSGGEVINLDLTFRAHRRLVEVTNRLLSRLMGDTDDPRRPHRVSFTPLTANRQEPCQSTRAPFVEFHLGLGDARAGRQAAAAALAARLRELCDREGFKWEDLALLFRAATAFPVYEDALEFAGIPFVTVAGKGFYDRPEIRDLVNALAAIADPADDLALAGLLRSPAFGLTDADLYYLRFPDGGDTPQPLYRSLLSRPQPPIAGPLPGTSGDYIVHAATTVRALHSLAGRLPVAELLKQFLDRTHYRAVLKRAGGSQRLSRNVDKLLADAHRSRLTSVGEFLEYVRSLRDVGAREGEAPAEAGGAVQLMTIHRAKGLEFPVVVIADAGYSHGAGDTGALRLDPDLGVLLKVRMPGRDADAARPFAWQLGALADADREEAEGLRLLYVAATRAREKILVSGHVRVSTATGDPGRILPTGWLKDLARVAGLDAVRLSEDEFDAPRSISVAPEWNEEISARLYPSAAIEPARAASAAETEPDNRLVPGPLALPLAAGQPEGEPGLALRRVERPGAEGWRVVHSSDSPPAWVVGQIVHAALRRWMFPDHPGFEARLRPIALEAGLLDEAAVRAALREASRLLERLRTHPIFAEMAAARRHHEAPYAIGGEAGLVDVLYRQAGRWTVADFKTDDVRDEGEMRRVIRSAGYDRHMGLCASAVAAQLGQRPRSVLVFLNVGGEVRVIDE